MKRLLLIPFIFVLTVFGSACSNGKAQEKKPSETKITIEPMKLSKKESELVGKTGVENIEYFLMNGSLKKSEDLVIKIELYKKGVLQEESMGSSESPLNKFKNMMLSFGTRHPQNDRTLIDVYAGVPNGFMATSFKDGMSGSTISSLISEKITLKKNKPVYLTAWAGTTKNSMSGLRVSDDGALPENLEKYEMAILYKIEITDK